MKKQQQMTKKKNGTDAFTTCRVPRFCFFCQFLLFPSLFFLFFFSCQGNVLRNVYVFRLIVGICWVEFGLFRSNLVLSFCCFLLCFFCLLLGPQHLAQKIGQKNASHLCFVFHPQGSQNAEKGSIFHPRGS